MQMIWKINKKISKKFEIWQKKKNNNNKNNDKDNNKKKSKDKGQHYDIK